MILVLFGQPRSGKSTIANELKGMFMNIDGDRLRKIFKNNDIIVYEPINNNCWSTPAPCVGGDTKVGKFMFFKVFYGK